MHLQHIEGKNVISTYAPTAYRRKYVISTYAPTTYRGKYVVSTYAHTQEEDIYLFYSFCTYSSLKQKKHQT